MALYNKSKIIDMFDNSEVAATNAEKGKIFEDLACYLFEIVPGITVAMRNTLNIYDTEEIDVSLWNERETDGLSFLNNVILVECKNWSKAVGSIDVNWFATKVEDRGLDFGILLAANGITGDESDLTRAKSIVSNYLKKHIRIIVIDKLEILNLNSTEDLIRLIKEKICILVVRG